MLSTLFLAQVKSFPVTHTKYYKPILYIARNGQRLGEVRPSLHLSKK